MKLEELKNAKATYELYGPTMLNPDVVNHLFALAIDIHEQLDAQAAKAEATEAEAPAKPKRPAKKAD